MWAQHSTHCCLEYGASSPVFPSPSSLSLPHGLPMSDIQMSTYQVIVLLYYCVVTHSGVQEAGEADTASMDEEQAAQEEVERLDSGTILHMSHGFASFLLVHITVHGIRGSGSACGCKFKQLGLGFRLLHRS